MQKHTSYNKSFRKCKYGLFLLVFFLMSIPQIGKSQQVPSRLEVRQEMARVADWQIAHLDKGKYGALNWVNATFYLGLSRWAEIAQNDIHDNLYYRWLLNLGQENKWNVAKRMYHADDVCVAQTWLSLYKKYHRPEMIAPIKRRADRVIANPPKGSFDLTYSDTTTLEHWTWCDALFMAPNMYMELYTITGDKKYLRFMDKEFKLTYKNLYDPKEHLFFRDRRYLNQKETNGQKVFWGRGNGWVLGGLVELLKSMPTNLKERTFYKKLYLEMCERVAQLQGNDGFWRASLLDPSAYPSPETSASGFMVYALAYGINEGLLSKEKYLPIVLKGWKALCSAVEEDGKLGYVQPIGADPKKVDKHMTEVYGPGAFLLAGCELYRLGKEQTNHNLNVISPEKVEQIAAMLSATPSGIGLTYKDRNYWTSIQKESSAQMLLKRAEEKYKKGFPPFIDSLYLQLNKTNYRLPGEVMMKSRFEYLFDLTLTECMENKGTYMAAIEQAIKALCRQKPWSIPAHDRNLANYNGTDYSVDLVVATAGNGIAQCLYLLDDKISPETRTLARCAFREKMFRPVFRHVETGKPFWWMNVTNNWNSVCLAGVTGAALAMLPDKEERAYYIAVADKYQGNGMRGYADDGYCTEGAGYYNYGFSAYILLREEVCRATGGKKDFFRTPQFIKVAAYGKNIQLTDGLVPTFSDCHLGLKIDKRIIDYCNTAIGIADAEKQIVPFGDNFSLYLLHMFPNAAWKTDLTPEMKTAMQSVPYDPARSWYDRAGILIDRPIPNSRCRLAIAAKGGNNAENHNHNDIGSYDVVYDDVLITGDQGGPESYPGDYFNVGAEKKYKIKGSWGHPVPVVDGTEQTTGKKAQGVVTGKSYTKEKDILTIDMKSAYPVPELTTLNRTFLYDRSGIGMFTVTDDWSAEKAISFGTALTTGGTWKMLNNKTLLITQNNKQMKVIIESSGSVTFANESISVNSPVYTRIGINLAKPAKKGYIKLTMLPLE